MRSLVLETWFCYDVPNDMVNNEKMSRTIMRMTLETVGKSGRRRG